jgi:hypothetical protein
MQKLLAAMLLSITLLALNTQAKASAAYALDIPARSSYVTSAIPYSMQYVPSPGSAANSSRYVTRAVAYTGARFGSLAKSFLLSPGGLALQAGLIAAGYLYDELTGDVIEPGEGTTTITGFWWYDNYTGQKQAATPEQVAELHAADLIAQYGPPGWHFVDAYGTGCYGGNGSTWIMCGIHTVDSQGGHSDGAIQVNYNAGGQLEVEDEDHILTGDELAEAIENDPYFNQFIPDILTDAYTGEPLVTPEVQDTLDDVVSDFDAAYDNDPGTVPDTDGGNDTGTEGETDQLTDCDFFPTICKFLDWFREPVDPGTPVEMPTESIEPATYNSGIGTGTCPTMEQIEYGGTTFSWNIQPACDFAGYLSYLIIGLSYVTAAMIMLGVKRG